MNEINNKENFFVEGSGKGVIVGDDGKMSLIHLQYKRLFINLGKRDGFFPGVLMQTLNRYVGGRQEVGHIDLLDTISYFEVPEKDARKVMSQLTGIRFKGRQIRCNAEDDRKNDRFHRENTEEGWARRKPKKK